MKKTFYDLVFCAGLLVLAACAPSISPQGDSGNLTGTVWSLTSLSSNELVPGSGITALFTAGGKLGGSSGCNQYSGTYTVTGSRLQISPDLASTMMACPQELMDQETEYIKALADVNSFSIHGDQLTLQDGNKKDLLVYKAQSQDLAGTAWDVISYNNGNQAVTSVLAGTPLTAAFGQDGTIAGHGGCNQYSGPYKGDGHKITIGPLSSTKKACSDPAGVMEQEAHFLAALQSAASYQIEGNTMELRTQDGALAVDLSKK